MLLQCLYIMLIEVGKSILNVGAAFYELNPELNELNIGLEVLKFIALSS